ncbi:MAG TPA: dienelactone hydrolase family protein, partial [Flavitalea sp.]|nr:dienelactone hydrolase family protein [Flavitalea sp.]
MKKIFYFLVLPAMLITACGDDPKPATEAVVKENVPMKIKEENITYKSDTTTLNSFIAFDESSTAKRPAVIIVPEWWGLDDYVKNRARQLAALGYIAIAV